MKRTLLGVLMTAALVLPLGAQSRNPMGPGAEVASATVGPTLPMDLPFTIHQLDTDQYQVAVAYNTLRDEYLVVWTNDWGGNRDLYAERLNGAGQPILWFCVHTVPGGYLEDPAVAYDHVNDQYLITWTQEDPAGDSDTDIHGRLVPWYGQVASQPAFLVSGSSQPERKPDVAFGDAAGAFLVVWEEMQLSGVLPTWVRGAFVDAVVGTVGPAVTVASGTSDQSSPRVAYNGAAQRFLVAWTDEEGVSTVRGRGITAAGAVSPIFPILAFGWDVVLLDLDACASTATFVLAAVSVGPPEVALVISEIDAFGELVLGPESVPETSLADLGTVACDPVARECIVAWSQDVTGGEYEVVLAQMFQPGRGLGTAGLLASMDIELSGRRTPAAAANQWRGQFLPVWPQERGGVPSWDDLRARVVHGDVVFADGFEWASTARWSSP